MATAEAAPRRGTTAAALHALAAAPGGSRMPLGDIVAALGEHGFGILVLLLALPNLLPGPALPGFSLPFAIGIGLLGLQLMFGLEAPVLPRWIARRAVTRSGFRRFVGLAEPQLMRLERWVRPRPSALTDRRGERLVGGSLAALSLVLALPVPLGNAPVALSVAIVALGLLESDGVALAWGLGLGLAAMLWNALLVAAGATVLELVARALHGAG
jgi:hypothetical protein